jgi:hypothetical protein
MARARIRLTTVHDLPPVCACCGEPAEATKSQKFVWNPPWLLVVALFFGALPLLFLIPLTRRSATLEVPVCDHHARRGWRAAKVLLVGLALAALVAGVGYLLLTVDRSLGENVLWGAGGVALVSSFAAIFVSDNNIRVKEIDDRYITVSGVSDEFARTVAEGHHRPVVPAGGMELVTAKYLRR